MKRKENVYYPYHKVTKSRWANVIFQSNKPICPYKKIISTYLFLHGWSFHFTPEMVNIIQFPASSNYNSAVNRRKKKEVIWILLSVNSDAKAASSILWYRQTAAAKNPIDDITTRLRSITVQCSEFTLPSSINQVRILIKISITTGNQIITNQRNYRKRRRRWMPDLKNLMGSLSFDKRWARVKMRELLPEAVAARSRRRSSPEDSWKQIPQRKSTPYGEQMMNESMAFAGRFGP